MKNKIEEWCMMYSYRSNNMLVDKLRDKTFNDKQILDILQIIGETCEHCWDGDSGCQCWNDE